MTVLTHDDPRGEAVSRTRSGLVLALISALTFGTSGSLAKGLMETGWSPAGAVTARVWIAALVLAVPTWLAMRGHWSALRQNARLIVAYGVIPVAGTQLAYFMAVSYMEVGLALLIEYCAPVVVIGWLWLRHGERPGVKTIVGATVAAAGLLLVLDVFGSGGGVHPLGLLFALISTFGAACYFVMSAHEPEGLPPIALAGTGLLVGAVVLSLAGAVGLVDAHYATEAASYAGTSVPWWLPVLGLGVVSAAIAYATGIAANRRLGPRLASFVALLEVVAAIGFAWLLLDELPGWIQLAGGVLILIGIVVVKLGERVPAPPTVEPV
ncbi:MAG: EamA family transporter [Myxococcales bacterium]|nr:MAG: EamA family transporter [Myxococcales bacterium]